MMTIPAAHDLDDVITTTISCATWLVQRDMLDLAISMRDEFLREWGFEQDEWNFHCHKLIDYVQRKGETPTISEAQIRAVMFL